MLYFVLKFAHVIGAAVLLGTGAGIAFFMLLAHRDGRPQVVAGVARIVVIADFLFTATAVVAQPLTGVWLALHVGYPLTEGWILLSVFLYLLTGAFWLPGRLDADAHAGSRGGGGARRLGPARRLPPPVLACGSPSASLPLPRSWRSSGS